ncbi:hypothetical protein SAMN04489761_3505 [Tenacibaculum sp. MAR_2009_124]|nr:hypothetical protein SAMN04489761_3505 [Tenacibaculum sp. MAR_2009_124]
MNYQRAVSAGQVNDGVQIEAREILQTCNEYYNR